jgi:hypothetical protein
MCASKLIEITIVLSGLHIYCSVDCNRFLKSPLMNVLNNFPLFVMIFGGADYFLVVIFFS